MQMVRFLPLWLVFFSLVPLLTGCEEWNPGNKLDGILVKKSTRPGQELQTLIARLKSTQWRRQFGAVRSMQAMGPKAAPAIPALLNLLRRARHFKVRFAIVKTFQSIGKAGVPALIQRFDAQDKRTQLTLVWAFGKIGPDAAMAVPHLLPLVNSSYRDTRRAVLYTFGQMGSAATSALPAITRIAKTGKGRAREEAIATLGALEKGGLPSLPMLLKLARNKGEPFPMREAALRSVGRLFALDRSKEVAALLFHYARHRTPALQRTAIEALGRSGYTGAEALELLKKLSRSPKRGVSQSARLALRNLKNGRTWTFLRTSKTALTGNLSVPYPQGRMGTSKKSAIKKAPTPATKPSSGPEVR